MAVQKVVTARVAIVVQGEDRLSSLLPGLPEPERPNCAVPSGDDPGLGEFRLDLFPAVDANLPAVSQFLKLRPVERDLGTVFDHYRDVPGPGTPDPEEVDKVVGARGRHDQSPQDSPLVVA